MIKPTAIAQKVFVNKMAHTYSQRMNRAQNYVQKHADSFTSSDISNATPEETVSESDQDNSSMVSGVEYQMKMKVEKMSLSPDRINRQRPGLLKKQ